MLSEDTLHRCLYEFDGHTKWIQLEINQQAKETSVKDKERELLVSYTLSLCLV